MKVWHVAGGKIAAMVLASAVALALAGCGGSSSTTMGPPPPPPTPPTVTGVVPNSGATTGGTPVTITGTNFAAGATVAFGGAAGTSVVVVNSTTITATTPAGGAGAVTVTVTVSGQNGNLAGGYTYVATPVTIVVSPQNASIRDAGAAQAYTATGYAANGTAQDVTAAVSWTSSNSGVATVNSSGTATSGTLGAGQSAGFTSITATFGGVKGVAILSVTSHTGNGFAGTFTQGGDIGRTGQNLNETTLTPAVVGNTTTFGKKFSQPVDGFIYAQPLYAPNVAISGKGTHNVVFVATEGDSVYAFDADSNTGANANPLWQASLIDTAHGATAGETTVDSNRDLGCSDLIPQVGITGTPAIDPSTNTMYVETKSREADGTTFVHRLHALDISTGNEKAGGPSTINATVAGTGDGSNTIVFDALNHMDRPGLLLVNGVVFLGYASHCDTQPYHGWVFAYDATTLAQKSVINLTPNGGLGGVWMSGQGLAADSQANVFVSTGNGSFDTSGTVLDFGDSIVKLSLASGALKVTDYFTPFDQDFLAATDTDVSSGGVLLLPDQAGNHRHELVQVGKEGTIYVVDRDQMTANNLHYCANCNSDTQIVQELPGALGGMWSSPAYWNNNVYFWGSFDQLRQYSITAGGLGVTPTAVGAIGLRYPGATPAISANGTAGAIVWAIDSTGFRLPNPAVLHAFDATNVANELYNTTMAANSRDKAGNAVKFTVPTIANGKVYIGTQTELDVYGTLP